LWRIFLDEGRISREESLSLSNQQVGGLGARPLQDGRFAYALMGDGTQTSSGTYWLTSLSEQPQRVNAMPDNQPGTEFPWVGFDADVFWAGDGSGAIIRWRDETYYAPANGNFLYNVTFALGRGVSKYVWQ
jgi:hypothetical protein